MAAEGSPRWAEIQHWPGWAAARAGRAEVRGSPSNMVSWRSGWGRSCLQSQGQQAAGIHPKQNTESFLPAPLHCSRLHPPAQEAAATGTPLATAQSPEPRVHLQEVSGGACRGWDSWRPRRQLEGLLGGTAGAQLLPAPGPSRGLSFLGSHTFQSQRAQTHTSSLSSVALAVRGGSTAHVGSPG